MDAQSSPTFDVPTQGLILAVADLQVLVGHVAVLLNDEYLKGSGIIDWLSNLDDVLRTLESSILHGRLTCREELTIDDEGPADLAEILAQRCFSENEAWPETGQSTLLAKLIDYWLDQVTARGHSLLHLLLGAEDVVGAAESLTKLNDIRYPLN
jgi:hypothetical protein